jgi:DNA helicase-2/ATP-dependent DNA helicase PcrA
VANRFAESISPRLPKAMEPQRPPAPVEVHAWAAPTDTDEAIQIADTIETLRARGFRHRDVAVLFRSVRTSSPPLVDELKRRAIPFRCAGRTGLFRQPEASVLGKTYAWLSGNDWKDERFAPSAPVQLEALLHEYEQVFAGGTPIEGLEEYLRDWQHLVADTSAQINLVRDYYRLLRLLQVQHVDLDDPAGSARMGCLARFSQILADYEHVTRRARYVDEDQGRVFRGGQDRGVYFYQRLFNYLQYYALDAYEDFEGEDTFDLDTVNILTVHQAKGLEWPVVFLPSLVDGRFPSRRAGEPQDWLVPEAVFGSEARMRYEGSETEERRLFYVGLTRARDALYLSRFHRRTRRFHASTFLLEVAGEDPAMTSSLAVSTLFEPPLDQPEELPTLSFSELALYEGCPLRYRLSTSLGFQPQLVTELGYGKAIHHILRRLADRTRATRTLPTPEDVEQVFREEFYLPFANRSAFEQLWNRAHLLVSRYLADYSADLLRVWETERSFELHLDRAVINGRADVILDEEGGIRGALAIVDYKTATEVRSDDVFAFQLAIYATAGRGEGIDVRAAYLHELADGTRRAVPVDEAATGEARRRANRLVDDVLAGEFPASPERPKCTRCDVRAICRHAACGKYDY